MQNTDIQKANPLLYLFRKTWKYSEGNMGKVVLFSVMFIIAGSLDLFIPPIITAKVLQTVQNEGVTSQNISRLLCFLAGIVLCDLTFWCLHGPARLLESLNAFGARLKYQKYLLKGVMNLPMAWHSNHHSGDTIDKIEKGTSGLHHFSEDTFEVIYSLVRLVGSYSILMYFFPPSGIIVLVMMIITAWIIMRFDKVLIPQYDELNENDNIVSKSVFDSISNITTVIILRVELLVFNAIVAKAERILPLFRLNNVINEIKWFLSAMCCTLMTVIVMGAYFVQHIGAPKGILIGEVYLLYRYLDNISNLFARFTQMYSNIVRFKAKIANAEKLATEFVDQSFGNHVLPSDWRCLSISGLNFSYESEEFNNPHLDDMSLTIGRGEKIAFVGESGSGKTTLLKVMRDLFHPSSLNLSVDGVDIPNGFEGISRAISLVPQSPELFATTILENITLGAEYAPEIVPREFTDMARFTEVVDLLPNGLQSAINEKGVNLSGGQQQRLALARGLLASAGPHKSLVLLDEPTSSLDAITEQKIYRNIFSAFRGKTVISSIHRLHLLPAFDRICVFKNGKIIATGSFDDLRRTCLHFELLWLHYIEQV